MQPSRVRRLSFEQLETKCSPSSMLLLIAPLDDAWQAAVETERTTVPIALSHSTPTVIETPALLRFIEQNTANGATEIPTHGHPSMEECFVADVMMKATDTNLRAMIICDTLGPN